MNETRRKPTTRTRYPAPFDKWLGVLYMPSHRDTAGHTKAFGYPVTETRLDIPRPLVTQSRLDIPRPLVTQSRLDIPRPLVTQSRLDIPRPLITQSHRHGWTYQGLWLPSHGWTYQGLWLPSHGWTYQGLWLPSHTDTAGHTKAFDYPVTQTRLDIPRPLVTQSRLDIPRPFPLVTQSHRHGWTYQGLWLPSHGWTYQGL